MGTTSRDRTDSEYEATGSDVDGLLDVDDGMLARTSERSVAPLVSDTVTIIAADASLRDAAERLRVDEVSLIAVGELSNVEGVVSERDVVRAVALGTDLDATSVSSIESTDLLWATTSSTIGQVAEEMMENYVRHILVRDDAGQLCGIVSMRDLLTEYLD